MDVILAKSAGFCWGVSRAVAKAREASRANQSRVLTDGPLIHNQQMMERLRTEGVIETDQPESAAAGDTLLIRAHGVPPQRRRLLSQLPANLIDATCPDVARIQGLIKIRAARGVHTIIFGDNGHAEVTGLLGYTADRGHVVSSAKDVHNLPDMQPVCLVSQSTQLPVSFQQIEAAVLERFTDAEILDTICESTRNRQQELMDMAGRVDAFVVVGGSHSANTLRLVELARSLRPTFHIQTASQLPTDELQPFTAVGLTAGASTPDFIIAEVRLALEDIQPGKDGGQ